MSDDPTKLTALMAGWSRMASTISLSPWTTFRMPAGMPDWIASSARRTGPEGSRSEGCRTKALSAAMAMAHITGGILEGEGKGEMTGTMAGGSDNEYRAQRGRAAGVK